MDAARNVTFDELGFWQVDVTTDVDGDTKKAEAAFEVARRQAEIDRLRLERSDQRECRMADREHVN